MANVARVFNDAIGVVSAPSTPSLALPHTLDRNKELANAYKALNLWWMTLFRLKWTALLNQLLHPVVRRKFARVTSLSPSLCFIGNLRTHWPQSTSAHKIDCI